MSKINTNTHVRMFDGAGWDTYRIGSKAHRKAEARRAVWQAAQPTAEQKAAHQSANRAQAAWMRENGVAPSGSAWKLVNAGERDIDVLKAANAADGLAIKAPADRKAPKAKKAGKGASAKVTAPVAEEKAPSAKKVAKRRSKAAKKAYATRVANGTVARENGKFVKASAPAAPVTEVKVDAAETVRKGGKKALLWADLSDAGMNVEALKAAGLSTAQLTTLRDALA